MRPPQTVRHEEEGAGAPEDPHQTCSNRGRALRLALELRSPFAAAAKPLIHPILAMFAALTRARAGAALSAGVRFNSVMVRYTEVPTDLFRIQSGQKVKLREYAVQKTAGRAAYDLHVHPDGLVHPAEGDIFKGTQRLVTRGERFLGPGRTRTGHQ